MRPGFDFERRMLDMDWRLVEAFNMNDIDTALLQEMVPTLTYALVTETACTSPRLSCKLIRILQLVVETFIECRKGDAYDAHVLQEDLIAVSNERDSFRLRLKEAKTDVKALKAQLARCTTLLKSCSQVLHAQGCSPHTIAAVESMLATSDSMMSTFTPTTDATMPKVAHLCAFCGKAFGTQDYLLKHIDRRHASTSDGVVGKGTIQGGGSSNNQTPNIDILTKLELLLAQHEVHMKKATADSADTLQALQNELAIERAVANELKLARSDLQWR
ncbi:hypothetical protein DYB36_003274 [Aphanomyces astaci]|uniref:C2H2-type domain-containing protein n=2 Tax=Aphanomyces astaci TaxID=112090 RepID=A0A396ZYA5_APHAT|nr:hypothetical protein DYB36_003274 [Aphanomyces astaci]